MTIRSLLDNEPYRHEPNQGDCPRYNDYVRYTTWQSLLFDYLNMERQSACRNFLYEYVRANGARMLDELERQERETSSRGLRQFDCRYDRRIRVLANYPSMKDQLARHIMAAGPNPSLAPGPVTPPSMLIASAVVRPSQITRTPPAMPAQTQGPGNIITSTNQARATSQITALRTTSSNENNSSSATSTSQRQPDAQQGAMHESPGSNKRKRDIEVIVID